MLISVRNPDRIKYDLDLLKLERDTIKMNIQSSIFVLYLLVVLSLSPLIQNLYYLFEHKNHLKIQFRKSNVEGQGQRSDYVVLGLPSS